MAFGEGDIIGKMRQAVFHHEDASRSPATIGTVLAASSLLFVYGVVNDEALIVTFGCFCIYTSFASMVTGDNNVSRAIVIAFCGLATMLLGEAVQKYMEPVQTAFASYVGHLPLYGIFFAGKNTLPLDLWSLREVLRDTTALVSGEVRLISANSEL